MIIPVVSSLMMLLPCSPIEVDTQAKSVADCALLKPGVTTLIAENCDPRPDGGPNGPAGPDPHGIDPHMEQTDPNLPANQYKDSMRPPLSPYGNDIPNSRSPY